MKFLDDPLAQSAVQELVGVYVAVEHPQTRGGGPQSPASVIADITGLEYKSNVR